MYEKQLQEMCLRLADIQSEDGLWRAGLLDQVAHPVAETSGSAFFVYGMAYAMNEGIVDNETFIPVIGKAWPALCGYVKEDGMFTGIQPIGDKPVKYDDDNTMPYGVGAFLLASTEVYKLADHYITR